MTVSISVPATPVTTSPGGSTPWVVAVRNPGRGTQVRLWVTGRAAPWLTVPDSLWLGPGEEQQLLLMVEPPPSAGPIGSLVQLVLHADLGDGREPATAAAVVLLAARASVRVAFEQPSAAVLRRATLPVVVRSEGTETAEVALTAASGVPCAVVPTQVVVPPDAVTHAEVRVNPPLRWWGSPRPIDVVVEWTTGGGSRGSTSTTLTQRTVLQRGVVLSVLTSLAVTALVCLLVIKAVR
jgi:hypothetical protein